MRFSSRDDVLWSCFTITERISRISELKNFVNSVEKIPEVVAVLNNPKRYFFEVWVEINGRGRRKLFSVMIRDKSPIIADIVDNISNARAKKVFSFSWWGGTEIPVSIWKGLTNEERVRALLPFVSLKVPYFYKFVKKLIKWHPKIIQAAVSCCSFKSEQDFVNSLWGFLNEDLQHEFLQMHPAFQ